MNRIHKLWFCPALLFGFLVTASARGDTITAELSGSGFNDTINPGAYVTINLGDGQAPWLNYKPGVVHWTAVGTPPAGIPVDFTTFCIELTQDITWGQQYTYTLTPLANAPTPGSSQTGGANGMGTGKATAISQLWAAFYPTIGTNGNLAAAFQLDVWEIEYNGVPTNPTTSNYFAGGNFQASGNDAVITQANTWLNYLAANPNLPQAEGLVALTSSGAQDQLTQLVPVPSSATLAGIGFLLLLGYRRMCQPAWSVSRILGA
jgi:hypothetical protein